MPYLITSPQLSMFWAHLKEKWLFHSWEISDKNPAMLSNSVVNCQQFTNFCFQLFLTIKLQKQITFSMKYLIVQPGSDKKQSTGIKFNTTVIYHIRFSYHPLLFEESTWLSSAKEASCNISQYLQCKTYWTDASSNGYFFMKITQ